MKGWKKEKVRKREYAVNVVNFVTAKDVWNVSVKIKIVN